MALEFPNIDPIFLKIGFLQFSWYGLSYAVGILISSWYCKYLVKKYNLKISISQLDSFICFLIIGIVFGGRLGYVCIYDAQRYFANPMDILKTYEGGMSFHGGLLGVLIATLMFCYFYKVSFWLLIDLVAASSPIAIFLGRIANFINGELYGRVTNFALGVKFPPSFLPRHPSQIYESLTEGLLSFCIIYYLITRHNFINKRGFIAASFAILYSIFRICCEFFRQPDIQIGFIANYFTAGQLLCLPLLISGIITLWLLKQK